MNDFAEEEITAVLDLPLREPAAMIRDRAVPQCIEPERTQPYRFEATRVIVSQVM